MLSAGVRVRLLQLLLVHAAVSQVMFSAAVEEQPTSKPSYRETKPNKFVSVNVACTPSTLMVVASMNDPFYGLVYARGFPLSCRTSSQGQRRVKLKVSVEDCGVKVVEDEDERTYYEMMVYIQYDRHVQQAIDEQILVRCNPDERIVVKASMPRPQDDDPDPVTVTKRPALPAKSARYSDGADFSAVFDDSGLGGAPAAGEEDTDASLAKHRASPGTSTETAAGQVRDGNPNMADSYPELSEQRRRQMERSEVARCWLDILKGEGLQGSAFFQHLDVGDPTTMLIKTRLTADPDSGTMDVLVTNCSAHDGSMERSQQLIDEHGCTLDPAIMSPLREHPQHGAGHRLHYSTFNAFKFPDRSSLHLRCTVLICRGQCPRRHCPLRRVARAARLGHGLIQPVSDAQLRSDRYYPIDRLLETLQMEIKDGSTIVDRIEVFNSADVQAPGIETVATRLRSKEPADDADRPRPDRHDTFLADDRLLCMTSSRLLLSFGVLMAVLAVSVLLALLLCIRQRQQTRKLRALQTFQRISTPAPTPHYYRVGPL